MTFNNKSCELDPLPTWLLKQCTEELLPLISAIINNSLESGVFPYQCKHAIIRPLLKKQGLDADDLKNYRPVSNLQFISKVLEKVVDQQIDEHLNTHSLNDPLQSAYRKNHSTETATIKLCNDIISGMDSGKCTVLASLDLTAAFDTVDHDIFLHRLQNVYGICGIALKWFKSYLSNREYRVSINSSLSNPHSLTCGVPQGSVLGARMYIMYTKPLTSIMAHHDVCYHCYADDTQVYLQCNNTEASIREATLKLERCIVDICEWMKNNALKINRSKTDFIVFGSKIDHQTLPPLTIGTDIIQPSETIKILGVTLDSQMNMQKDIAGTCRSVYMHIRKVNSIRRYLTKDATKLLINSTVLSRLDYCNSSYVGLPQTSTHKLQLAENAAARVIIRTPRHQHITPILNELNWLPVTKRCQLKILVLTFKVLQGQAPTYICEMFQWYTLARPLRSSSTTSLVPNRNKTVRYGKRLIDTSTAALWNSLPNNIKCARNIRHFKKLVKLYMSI